MIKRVLALVLMVAVGSAAFQLGGFPWYIHETITFGEISNPMQNLFRQNTEEDGAKIKYPNNIIDVGQHILFDELGVKESGQVF